MDPNSKVVAPGVVRIAAYPPEANLPFSTPAVTTPGWSVARSVQLHEPHSSRAPGQG